MIMCVHSPSYGKDILEFVHSSKNIIEADTGDENEMNKEAPVFPRHLNKEQHEKYAQTRGLGATPLRVKEDTEDVSSELSNRFKGCTSWMKRPELYCSRNCWEQWTREGTHVRKTVSGETRKTTRREDRRIVRLALVDPTVTRSMIRADVGVAIAPQTISRHLAETNMKSKCPFRALPLTP
ncbi:HTH_Tnp_Tc3_2 domain-containing protein [Trichonephila clavipes]|nr:HTH_Tnp_Tc3_2 domain-containing protein [Trichonephila clavipes]